jgi:cell division septation protein DedD
MANHRRPVQDGEIRITQSHLAALGVVFVSIASLTFLLGMQVGKLGGVRVEVEAQAPYTPDPIAEDRLESMLREVELARAATAPANDADLRFPEALTGAAAVASVAASDALDAGSSEAVEAQPLADARPPAPVAVDGAPPLTGWSVQVATTRDVSVARQRRDELIEAGWPAYVVSSYVDGQSWYRVRVGGFPDATHADHARAKLSLSLGHDAFALTVAP